MPVPVDPELAIIGGAAVLTTVFLVGALRHELGLPVVIGMLIVPIIVGIGFGSALVLRARLPISLLEAAGVLTAAMVPLLLVYELADRDGERPPPKRNWY